MNRLTNDRHADRRRRIDLRSEDGSISPFIMILLPALIGLAGLAYDGGIIFAARREANSVAAAAARAGANDLDEPSIYAGNPELASSAPGTAMAFAFAQGATTATSRQVEHDLIEVDVTWTVDLEFMGLFGIDTVTVDGEAEARVRDEVRGP